MVMEKADAEPTMKENRTKDSLGMVGSFALLLFYPYVYDVGGWPSVLRSGALLADGFLLMIHTINLWYDK
jgi:hypothetical protein